MRSGTMNHKKGLAKNTAGMAWALIVMGCLSAADAEAQDITGRWKDPNGEVFTFEMQTLGAIELRVPNSKARGSMTFRGQFKAEGFEVPARVTSIAQISEVFSRQVRRQLLREYPDITYSYMVKVVDESEITLTVRVHEVTANSENTKLKVVRLNRWVYDVTLTRDKNLCDLRVEKLTCKRTEKTVGGRKVYEWRIVARIRNAGDADVPGKWFARLMYADPVISHHPGPPWRKVTDSLLEQEPLAKGETVEVTWETDVKAPSGTPPFLPNSAQVLKVVVDPEKKVDESIETNNHAMLEKIVCAPPDMEEVPKEHSLWYEVPDGVDVTTAPKPDYWDIVDRVSDSDKANAVLCYIRMEAQRRAKVGVGSVAGTNFLKGFKDHFLADYLKQPSEASAKKAIAKIGKAYGFEGLPVRIAGIPVGAIGLYVPKSIRAKFPGLPEWLYGATYFAGEHGRLIRVIDAPFLIGADNLSTEMDSDIFGGGRNYTQVMHWATGVKYSHLSQDALRTLFIGYEYLHLEGWEVFGEDAINDLIAEEQGRMLGARLARLEMRSEADLVRKMDADFIRARKWVGAMLKIRREELDELILKPKVPEANIWWSKLAYVPPWGTKLTSVDSIRERLDGGKTVKEVCRSGLVEQLIQIYTLIYEASGRPDVGEMVETLLKGGYDDMFKSMSDEERDWGATWEWDPGTTSAWRPASIFSGLQGTASHANGSASEPLGL
ncbi:MAG: hypothetical protein IH851_09075 [Armatimonadetes bacterium]|nr:hypothetical protein [Armatimonadota bacterium]